MEKGRRNAAVNRSYWLLVLFIGMNYSNQLAAMDASTGASTVPAQPDASLATAVPATQQTDGTVAAPAAGSSGDATQSLPDQITAALAAGAWNDQIYALSDIVDDTVPADTPASVLTQLFNAIKAQFDNRLTEYQQPGGDADIEALNLLLSNASKNITFSADQLKQLTSYLQNTIIEQLIFENKDEQNYDTMLTKATTIITSAAGKTFSPVTQNIFATQVAKLFQGRAGKTDQQAARLLAALTKAGTCPLLSDPQQKAAATYATTVTLEISIRTALKDPTYANQLAKLTKIQTDNSGSGFGPITQDIDFGALSAVFTARSGKAPADIKALIALLNAGLTTGLTSDDQKTKIKAMLAQLAVEGAIIDASNAQDFPGKIAGMQNALQLATSNPIDSDTQKLYKSILDALMAARPKAAIDQLTQFKKLLDDSLASKLVADGDKAAVQAMQAQVVADLAAAAMQQALKDIMANPDYNARMAALDKFMKDNAGKVLDPTTQKMLQDAMQNLIDNRPQGDATALGKLADFLKGASGNPLLPDAFKQSLLSTTLPAIAADLDHAAMQQALKGIMANPDYNARMAALDKFMKDNAGKVLDPATQKMLQDALQKLHDTRPQGDAAALGKLNDLMKGLGNSPLLSDDFKKNVASNILPAVASDLDHAAMQQALKDLLASPDYNARLAGLDKFMKDNAGKVLDPATQKMLQDALQKLHDTRPQGDAAALGKLNDLMKGIGNSPLLSDDFKKNVASNILPAVAADLDHAAMQQALKDLLANPDYNARLAGLDKFMKDNAGKVLDPATQKTLQDALQKLHDTRPQGDATALAKLNDLMKGLGNNPLLSDDFKKNVASNILPAVAADLDHAAMQQALKDLLASPDYNARLAGLDKFMKDNAGKILDPATQKTLQDAIQNLHDTRPQGDAAALGKLSDLMKGLGNNPLLSDDFKKNIASTLLPAIAANQTTADLAARLADIANTTDPSQKAQKIADLINSGLSLDPVTAAKLADMAKDLANNPAVNANALKNLTDALGRLSGTPGVPDTVKNNLIQQVIPSLINGGHAGLIQNTANTMAQQTTISSKVDQFNQLLNSLNGQTLSDANKAALNQALADLIKSSPTNPADAAKLADLLKSLGNNPLIDSNLLNHINSTVLPGLQQPINPMAGQSGQGGTGLQLPAITPSNASQVIQSTLQSLAQQPSTATKIDQMSQLIGQIGNTAISGDAKNAINQGLADLIKVNPTNPADAAKLADLLRGLGNNPLIDPNLLNHINSTVLPGLLQPINPMNGFSGMAGQLPAITTNNASQVTQEMIQRIMQQTSVTTKVDQMSSLINQISSMPLSPDAKNALNQGIGQLIKLKPFDPNDMSRLAGLLGGLQNNPLVDPSLQQQIKTNALPTLNPANIMSMSDITNKTTSTLQTIQQSTSTTTKIDDMHRLITNIGSIPLAPAAQNALNQSLGNLLDLHKSLDPADMQKLAGLLGGLQNNPNVSSALQQQIQSILTQYMSSTTTTRTTQETSSMTNMMQQTGPMGQPLLGLQPGAGQLQPGGMNAVDPLEQELIAEIARVMQLPALMDRINGISAVMAKGQGKTFSNNLHNAYATALQNLFDQRNEQNAAVAGTPEQQKAAATKKSKAHKAKIKAASKKNKKGKKSKGTKKSTAPGKKKGKKSTHGITATPIAASAATAAQPAAAGTKKKKSKKKKSKKSTATPAAAGGA